MIRSRSASRRNSTSKSQQGFSLLELMIVVAITGVLAALAIPAFSGYLRKSRTSEATNFLGVIKLREESYRSEFGRYAGTGSTLAAMDFAPGDQSMMNNSQSFAWGSGSGDYTPFNVIGAQPDGAVRFGYGVIAGAPNQAAAVIGAAPYNVPTAQLDFYFIAQGVTDLDGRGPALTMEISSFTRTIWVSNANRGWD